jgi:serine beta-lactamase-like protein LACTB
VTSRFSLLWAIAACSSSPQSPPPAAPRPPSSAARASEILREIVAHGVPGASAAVAKDGTVVWADGAGFADVDEHVAVTPATRFRIASISKALTSSALVQLVDARVLDLDRPIQTYVPAFPTKPFPLTVRELAEHTSGIRHYRDHEALSTRHCDRLADGLDVFATDALLFEPGMRFAYSSYAWNLVGVAIEAASGQRYVDYMHDHVIVPLGLASTVPEDGGAPGTDQAHAYLLEAGRVVPAPAVDNTCKLPSGGWLSTPSDLARYGAAVLAGPFLTDAERAMLFTPVRTGMGKPTGFGMGWELTEENGRRIVFHSGGAIGGAALLWLVPDAHLVVALMFDVSGGDAGKRLGEAARALEAVFAPTAR